MRALLLAAVACLAGCATLPVQDDRCPVVEIANTRYDDVTVHFPGGRAVSVYSMQGRRLRVCGLPLHEQAQVHIRPIGGTMAYPVGVAAPWELAGEWLLVVKEFGHSTIQPGG